jgi:hypothetical protein
MRVNIGCTLNSSSALKKTAAVKMPSVTACVRAFERRVGFRVIAILKGRTTAIGASARKRHSCKESAAALHRKSKSMRIPRPWAALQRPRTSRK